MALSPGRPEIVVGLIDGPVAIGHFDLSDNVREAPGAAAACAQATSAACLHGTFVAGVLTAKRGSVAPAICPGCTLIVRPVFAEAATGDLDLPSAEPEELAAAILACIEAGARVINLSLALMQSSPGGRVALVQALDHAARRGVLIVAAAGNQGMVGGTIITAHPWVVPVGACDLRGVPLERIQSWPFHRAARPASAWRTGHQPRQRGQAAHAWRNQRRGAVRHGRDRPHLVARSCRARVRSAPGLPQDPCARAKGDAAVVGRLGGLPDSALNACEEVTSCPRA